MLKLLVLPLKTTANLLCTGIAAIFLLVNYYGIFALDLFTNYQLPWYVLAYALADFTLQVHFLFTAGQMVGLCCQCFVFFAFFLLNHMRQLNGRLEQYLLGLWPSTTKSISSLMVSHRRV